MTYLEPIINKAEEVLLHKDRILIVIDGCAASGKTTAAAKLAEYFHGAVIHMDDFFLPLELRTPERLAQPGGNIHYERFLEQVFSPLLAGKQLTYQAFDCSKGDYGRTISISPGAVTIIEGAYSMRPGFINYDIGVFFESREEVQYRRILKRNGPEKLEDFRNRFIPMENNYFAAFSIRQLADLLVDTSVIF